MTRRPRALRALALLASLADGRPANQGLDAFIARDPVVAEAVFRATASAATGMARPRTLTQAFTLLGRDAMIDRLLVATAFLLGECGGDDELSAMAIRRSRAVGRLASALDRVAHPRACALAGLLSVADVALGMPPVVLADEIAAPPPIRDALVHRETPLGALLDLVEAHENGWWEDLFARCGAIGIAPTVVGAAWTEGWQQAREEQQARAMAEA